MLFSTLLGGSRDDFAYKVAVDQRGCLYVTGITGSVDYPVYQAYRDYLQGSYNALITKICPFGPLPPLPLLLLE